MAKSLSFTDIGPMNAIVANFNVANMSFNAFHENTRENFQIYGIMCAQLRLGSTLNQSKQSYHCALIWELNSRAQTDWEDAINRWAPGSVCWFCHTVAVTSFRPSVFGYYLVLILYNY